MFNLVSNIMETIAGPLVGSIIADAFNLNGAMKGAFIILLPILVKFINSINVSTLMIDNMYIITTLVFLSITGFMLWKGHEIYVKEKEIQRNKLKTSVIVYTQNWTRVIAEYFLHCLESRNNNELQLGDIDMSMMALRDRKQTGNSHQNSYLPTIGKKIHFYDEYIKSNGTIVWYRKKETHKEVKEKSEISKDYAMYYCKLTIDVSDFDISDYISSMNKRVHDKLSNQVVLRYLKIHGETEGKCDYISFTMYEGSKLNKDELKKEYIDSFFHQEKDRIWNYVEKVHYDPDYIIKTGQVPRASYIFYGPPGSGKSSLISRIAYSLGRHIISIDLSSIRNKSTLLKVIYQPMIGEIWGCEPKDYIVVLEELDVAIKQLNEETDKKDKMKSLVDVKWSSVYQPNDKTDDKEKRDYTDIYNSYKEIKRNYTIRDLLEVVQGSFTANGMIIIATTNKLDEIEEQCPELVRDGRLTKVRFGYLDINNFKLLCNHYFGTQVIINQYWFDKQGECLLPTSTLTEMAINATIADDDKDKASIIFQNMVDHKIAQLHI
jgi:hypothetical protein